MDHGLDDPVRFVITWEMSANVEISHSANLANRDAMHGLAQSRRGTPEGMSDVSMCVMEVAIGQAQSDESKKRSNEKAGKTHQGMKYKGCFANRAEYLANPVQKAKIKAQKKKYYENNEEKHKAYDRDYRTAPGYQAPPDIRRRYKKDERKGRIRIKKSKKTCSGKHNRCAK